MLVRRRHNLHCTGLYVYSFYIWFQTTIVLRFYIGWNYFDFSGFLLFLLGLEPDSCHCYQNLGFGQVSWMHYICFLFCNWWSLFFSCTFFSIMLSSFLVCSIYTLSHVKEVLYTTWVPAALYSQESIINASIHIHMYIG